MAAQKPTGSGFIVGVTVTVQGDWASPASASRARLPGLLPPRSVTGKNAHDPRLKGRARLMRWKNAGAVTRGGHRLAVRTSATVRHLSTDIGVVMDARGSP